MGPNPTPLPVLTVQDKQTLLRLARQTLKDYLGSGSHPDLTTDVASLLQPRATFVTLRRKDNGELRGCRGEVVARQSLIESVVHTTIASATEDPRFMAVSLEEIPHVHIEISALTPLAPIAPDSVVVGRHGLMIRKGPHAGLLLPQVPTAYGWNRDQFLNALCDKAGLPRSAWKERGAELSAFEAEVWQEE
jgi:AmmeMemoRadiSam system protein A